MTAIDVLLKRNLELGDAVPGDRRSPRPSLRVAVLTCMDARVRVFEIFGLVQGESHVLRNAGGVVTDDMIRSLALSQRKLGTREVMIVQHTDCGLSLVTEDDFKDELEADTGLRPTWSVEAFREVSDSVRRSMQRVKRSDFLLHTDAVRGFVYDVKGGALTEIE
ncbi:beta-class carbonic anhydrase [Amycolatopsis keratiniphila]|uniref:carbonic anhydrase n=1 Tax=Amycolatopsis keratiniphila subsp. keratiniphila TaxID=227715 RepID=A0A1W2LZ45_9PSEU|nr:carbonic anhydrase [Amycolatopsis keratiniphila]OLZ58114.1 carbonic anhydrase [Amycolatopsis keratiniphila subsp. nogabecina]ONF72180.1 carbonic anhydrase [Amycolatopsis keratiniphila subsp. keratiniphila]SDU44198.1 carbonic anhydrase [Amycolatopsis keratiniphila]